MHRLLLRALLLSLLSFLASCADRVDLSPADRALVSPLRVGEEVGLPEKIRYVEPEGTTSTARGEGYERQTLHGTLGERADRGSVILRDCLVRSLKAGGIEVREDDEFSDMSLTLTDLGLLPVGSSRMMQFQITVDALLADRSGRVIWESQASSHPYREQLPARSFEAYRASNELVQKDFAVICQHVADELVKELTSQMTTE